VFDGDDGNVEHIARHRLTPDEAEEAVLDPRRIGAPARNTAGERRWAAPGATMSGRVLPLDFTRRAGLVRVITARDAGPAQWRRYREE
jgi:uncharacterized protein